MSAAASHVVDPRIGSTEVRERADDEQEHHKNDPEHVRSIGRLLDQHQSRFLSARSAQLITNWTA